MRVRNAAILVGMVFALAGLLASCLWGQRAAAAGTVGRGALLVGVGVSTRVFDTMSAGDIRPVARGEVGSGLAVSYRVLENADLAVLGHFEGAWMNFNNQSQTGKIEDVGWSLGCRGEWIMRLSPGRAATAGLGFEYGETRSWLDNLLLHDEGPHGFMAGGTVSLGITQSLCRHLSARLGFSEWIYRAHAKDPPSGGEFNWLGRSLELSAGLVVAVGGRTSD